MVTDLCVKFGHTRGKLAVIIIHMYYIGRSNRDRCENAVAVSPGSLTSEVQVFHGYVAR